MGDLQARWIVSSCRHPGHVDLSAAQVVVVLKDGELLGVPEGDGAGHVDAEGLVALLEAAHGEELEGVNVVAKIQPAFLPNLQKEGYKLTIQSLGGEMRVDAGPSKSQMI